MKNTSNILQIAAVLLFIGSFFADDVKKKKHLRLGALASFGIGYGMQFTKSYKR